MDETTLKNLLQGLSSEIASVRTSGTQDRSENRSLLAEVGGDGVKELLDSIQIKVKYLLFDLEATHRENTVLRKMLKEPES